MMEKMFIVTIMSSFLIACGGGTSSPTPASTPASTPAPTPTPTPTPVSADFPITENNQELVRYQPNNFIKYSAELAFRGNSIYSPSNQSGTYSLSYSYSNDPAIFRDGEAETITKSHSFVLDGSAISYSQEVIQFPSDWDDTPSTLEWVYYENSEGYKYAINRQYNSEGNYYSNFGTLSMIGSAYVGYFYTNNFITHRNNTKSYGDDSEDIQVYQELEISSTEIVETAIGTFEAYKVAMTITETYEDGDVDSTVGLYWLHPSIGIIKAELTETVGTESFQEVYDYSYSITSTNLAY
jgi:hypothetical protein